VFRRNAAAAVAALMLTAAALPAAAKPICYTPTEIRAMQFRQLQVELMVSALKCRSADPSFQDKYASYIDKVGPALKRNAGELRAMFTRLGRGSAAMDKYTTELSNQASMRSLHIEYGEYCAGMDEVFGKILAMKANEVEAYAADTVEKPYSPASCSQPAIKTAKAKDTKPVAKKAVEKKG
jgi:hypothetical protein